MRQIRHIIIHCSATSPDMDVGAAEIRQWHKDRGWQDIGYHFIIRRDGTLELGRPEREDGAHTVGRNHDSIGICVIGGTKYDKKTPDCNFTAAQWGALSLITKNMAQKYPEAKVSGHRDHTTAKACPTFDAISWFYGKRG